MNEGDTYFNNTSNIRGSEPEKMDPPSDIFEARNDIDQEVENETEHHESLYTTLVTNNTVPRPPTKPNIPIGDETICPVCTQKGMQIAYIHTHTLWFCKY